MSKELFNPTPSNYNKEMSFVDFQEFNPSVISDLKKNQISLNNDSNAWQMEGFNNNSNKTPNISICQNHSEIGKIDDLTNYIGSFMNQTKNGKIMSLENSNPFASLNPKNTTINSIGDPMKTSIIQPRESKFTEIGLSFQKKLSEDPTALKEKQSSQKFNSNQFAQENQSFLNNKSFTENNYDFRNLNNKYDFSQMLEQSNLNSQIPNINHSNKLDILNSGTFLETNLINNNTLNNSLLNLNNNLSTNYFITSDFNSKAPEVSCNSNQKMKGSFFNLVSGF